MRVQIWCALALLGGVCLLVGWAWFQPPDNLETLTQEEEGTAERSNSKSADSSKTKKKTAKSAEKAGEKDGNSPTEKGGKLDGEKEKLKQKELSAKSRLKELSEPWGHLLASVGAPPRFQDVCFDDFSPEREGMDVGELRRWLAPVAPNKLRITSQRGRGPVVTGLVKLRAPWREETALRLSLSSQQPFHIHVFSGEQGVSLAYYAAPRPSWAAYTTVRKPGDARPQRLAFVGSDNDRYSRSGAGSIALHYEAGQLAMTRGNVLLLSVPLANPPSEVFFEGRVEWRGIAMFRCGLLPPEHEPRPLVLRAEKPSKLSWRENLPRGAAFQRLEDGRVRLTARRTSSEATATCPIREPGLYEVIFQIEDPQPGTGFFLGDPEGRPLHRVGFFREQRGGGTAFEYCPVGNLREMVRYDPQSKPAPLVGPRQWFRLVLGIGSLKCWTSGDGRHWARIPQPPLPRSRRDAPMSASTIGVYCLPHNPATAKAPSNDGRRITLRSLEIRELSGITSLATAEAREQAFCLDRLLDVPSWLQAVAESQPRDLDSADWRRACAIRTLSGAPSRVLAKALLDHLLREAIEQPGPERDRLRLLEDAGLIWDGWQAAEMAQFVGHYRRLGEALLHEGHPRPLETMAPALVRSTIWSSPALAIVPGALDDLAKADLLSRVNHRQWQAVLEFRRQLSYWTPRSGKGRSARKNSFQQWIDWATVLAVRSSDAAAATVRNDGRNGAETPRDGNPGGRPREKMPVMWRTWRHPLIEQISKEGYNVLAEFEAALDGEAFEDACQIITAADPRGALGLLPDGRDPQLMVSLPGAVALAMHNHPGLKQAMRERFGAAGLLRVRQAKLAGDAATIRAATVQFFGAEAAAEAHRWLADRALAAGDFDDAMGHYARALDGAGVQDRRQARAMFRLAAAMAGRDAGQKVQHPVEFGGTRLSAAEFESLVEEMRARSGDRGVSVSIGRGSGQAAPAPARYESRPWAYFHGRSAAPVKNIDWAPRQMSVVVAQGTMYVSDRRQLIAYDLENAKVKWTFTGVGARVMHKEWSGVAAWPLITRERIFFRRLTTQGSEIACLETATGKVIWPTKNRRPKPFTNGGALSDPLLIGGRLMVFTAVKEPGGSLDVRLTFLHRETGEILAERSLIQLRNISGDQLPCEAVAADDLIVATIGGCVLCCDATGQAKWVRRQTRRPVSLPDLGESSTGQHRDLPLVRGQRVYVSQRGVRAVECLDLETGRLHWRHVLSDLRSIVGWADGYLILETASGLQGLDAATGEFLWRRNVSRLLETRLCGTSKQQTDARLLYARADSLPGAKWRTTLAWLDPKTGRDAFLWPLETPTSHLPLAGPLVAQGKRMWMIVGENPRGRVRRIIELIPQGKPLAGQSGEPELIPWLTNHNATLRQDVASVLPGWTLTAGENHPKIGWQGLGQSKMDVVVTWSDSNRPVRMLRRIDVPADGSAKLAIQVGHQPGARWELAITAAGKPLLRTEVSEKTANGGWLRREIDLSAMAGQTVWLAAVHRSLGPQASYANWKQMEFVVSTSK